MEISRYVQVPFDPRHSVSTPWVAEPADGQEKCSPCVLLVHVPLVWGGSVVNYVFVSYIIGT